MQTLNIARFIQYNAAPIFLSLGLKSLNRLVGGISLFKNDFSTSLFIKSVFKYLSESLPKILPIRISPPKYAIVETVLLIDVSFISV